VTELDDIVRDIQQRKWGFASHPVKDRRTIHDDRIGVGKFLDVSLARDCNTEQTCERLKGVGFG
jgi:hypothetical protein